MKDYYRILQVGYDSSTNEIEKAYQQAMNHHASDNQMKKDIKKAYRVLSNYKKRSAYNRQLLEFSNQYNRPILTSYGLEDNKGKKYRKPNKRWKGNFQYRFAVFTILGVTVIAAILLIQNEEWEISRIYTVFKDEVQGELAKHYDNSNSSVIDEDDKDMDMMDETDEDIKLVEVQEWNDFDDRIIQGEVPASLKTQPRKKDYARVSVEVQPNWTLEDITFDHYSGRVTEYHMNEHIEQDMMDGQRIEHLDRRLWYQLKEAKQGMTEEEIVGWLKSNPDEFFYEHMTWAMIDDGYQTDSIYERLHQIGAAITYRVYDNTAKMMMFMPYDYIAKDGEATIKERIYLFIMYDVEIDDGKIYSRCNIINPLVFWVNSDAITQIDDFIDHMEQYRFPYIDIKSALDIYEGYMGTRLNLDDIEDQLVLSTRKTNIDLRPPYKDEINFFRISSLHYQNILEDPFLGMTYTEKINKLSEEPEEFLDQVLLDIYSESSGLTMKEVLKSANATIHYDVDYKVTHKKGYVYGAIPIACSMLDEMGSPLEEVFLFYLYEINIGADNQIHCGRDLKNPFVCIIQDKSFYENCSAGEFQWQYQLVSDSQNLDKIALDLYKELILYRYTDERPDELFIGGKISFN